MADFGARLSWLYLGAGRGPRLFRLGLLAFEIAILSFFVISSFMPQQTWVLVVDVVIAVVLIADFSARLSIHHPRKEFFKLPSTWADIVVILSLLLAAFVENLLFLRALRAVRLFRSYQVLRDLRNQFKFFERNSEAIEAGINLLVFLFVMAAIVYVLEAQRHPKIDNYIDALYFTVSTMTTTGFGDIVFEDTLGRLLSIFIMIIGVTLFIRLAQAVFRPNKVRFECPDCGLMRHDPDAVHCKACGRLLRIPDDGYG